MKKFAKKLWKIDDTKAVCHSQGLSNVGDDIYNAILKCFYEKVHKWHICFD
ncbi:hypothetical protein HYD70_02785 [Mycoplasmopsis bovis]|nr:hypothetical protein HYD70_02785 [Mycoplasmopsis bovis]